MEVNKIRFRFTLRSEDENRQVVEFLKKYSNGHYVIIQHDAHDRVSDDKSTDSHHMKPHYHALIYTDKSLATMRKYRQNELPSFNTNDFHSMSMTRDEDRYLRYMCHAARSGDIVNVIDCQGWGYSRDFFQTQNQLFWVERNAPKDVKTKNFRELLLKKSLDLGLSSFEEIARLMWKEYPENTKCYGRYQCKNLIWDVWVRVNRMRDDSDAESTFIHMVCP